jgi:predicted ATP-grasp superfamily ATP-dependent carboligase
MTRQLVGEPWLHARTFAYCGSVGPLHVESGMAARFERLGSSLASTFGLRGLFGVDCLLDGDTLWLIEVNPRYTASVEILEYALNFSALSLHRDVFTGEVRSGFFPMKPGSWKTADSPWIGKAILFARQSLRFPAEGHWQATLSGPEPIEIMPTFADVPRPGTLIAMGWPILTFFAQGHSCPDCIDRLRRLASDLDRSLFRA